MTFPTFRSATSQSVYSGPIVLNRPSSARQADVLIAVINADGTPAAPSGWTLVTGSTSSIASTWVFTKVAGPSEPASYTFNLAPSSAGGLGVLLAYENPDPTGAVVDVYAPAAGATAPSVTTTANNETVIVAASEWLMTPGSAPTAPAGTTSRVAASGGTGATGYYTVRVCDFIQATAGATGGKAFGSGDTAVTVALVAKVDPPPNTPPLIAPVASSVRDTTKNIDFEWGFSDTNPHDSQLKYELRHRPSGGSTWTTIGPITSVVSKHTVSSGTFTAGVFYEWQVRVYDQNDQPSSWSTTELFKAAAPPPTPNITAPSTTVDTDPYVVTWTSAGQAAYELLRLAEDGETVLWTSGVVTSVATSRSVSFPDNLQPEVLKLRVRNSDGLWSSYDEQPYDVDYTTPLPPQPNPVLNTEDASVELDLGLAPTPPAPATFSRASTAHVDGVSVASGVPRYVPGRNIASLNGSLADIASGWSKTAAVEWEALPDGGFRFRRVTDADANITNGDSMIPVTPGESITISADVVGHCALKFMWRNAAGSYAGEAGSSAVADNNGRVSYTGVVPAGVAFASPFFRPRNPGDFPSLPFPWVELRRVQVERGAVATPWRPGGPSAVLVEEGTTNLLNANQSSMETDASAWTVNANCALTSVTTPGFHGTKVLRMTSVAAGTMNARLAGSFPAVVAGTAYTFSAYTRAATIGRSVTIRVRWRDAANTVVLDETGPVGGVTSVVGQMTRVTWTATAPANATQAEMFLQVSATGAAEEVHDFDAAQIEAKPYATSWQPGGVAREKEALTIPPEAFTADEGTVEMQLTPLTSPVYGRNYLEVGVAGNRGFLVRAAAANASSVEVQVYNPFGAMATPAGVIAPGKRVTIAVAWDASGTRVYADGALAASIPNVPSALSAGQAITVGRTGPYDPADAAVDGLRFSSRARTAAELADWSAPLIADRDTTWFQDFRGTLARENLWGNYGEGVVLYPTVTASEVWVRVAAGGERDIDRTVDDEGIRLAVGTGLEPGASFVDLLPRGNTKYEYRVKLYADNETTVWSAWTPVA